MFLKCVNKQKGASCLVFMAFFVFESSDIVTSVWWKVQMSFFDNFSRISLESSVENCENFIENLLPKLRQNLWEFPLKRPTSFASVCLESQTAFLGISSRISLRISLQSLEKICEDFFWKFRRHLWKSPKEFLSQKIEKFFIEQHPMAWFNTNSRMLCVW